MTKQSILAVLLAVLPGCPLLDVDVEIAEACITYRDVHVEPVPAGEPLQSTFVVTDFAALQDLLADDSKVEFVRAELRATSGITDFTFVEQVHVTVASGDPESTLPTVAVFDCADCGSGTARLAVPASAAGDAAPYLATGSLVITVDLTGTPPAQAFTMDVDACVSGNAAIEL